MPNLIEEYHNALKQISLMAMGAQSDPYAKAEVYRRALADICNYALCKQDHLRAAASDDGAARPPDFTMSCSACGEPVILDHEDADVKHKRCGAARPQPAQEIKGQHDTEAGYVLEFTGSSMDFWFQTLREAVAYISSMGCVGFTLREAAALSSPSVATGICSAHQTPDEVTCRICFPVPSVADSPTCAKCGEDVSFFHKCFPKLSAPCSSSAASQEKV